MTEPLDAAVRALRVRTHRAPSTSGETRARLLCSVERRERNHRLQIAALVTLAIVATNSTTWAWFSGALPRAIEGWTASAVAPQRDTSRVVRAPQQPASTPTAVALIPQPAPEVTVVQSALEQPAPAPVSSSSTHHERAATSAVTQPDEATRSRDTLDRNQFEAAHAVHFSGANPEGALGEWDRYLAEWPEGRFVPEASWNRAICLVRLSRLEEARVALLPFANGAHEGIRREEAERLLASIDAARR